MEKPQKCEHLAEGKLNESVSKKRALKVESAYSSFSETMDQKPIVIIGGGITALSIAVQLSLAHIPFIILEKSPRIGGQIETRQVNGYTFETGPNTGSFSTPEVAELFDFAQCPAEIAQEAAKARWIWKKDRFYPLPSSVRSAITTPLFRFSDKLRILAEPWRKRGSDPHESIGALAERRLGKSFVDYAVDPFIGGIYAGDPYVLCTRYALPKLHHLEQEHGSFIRGSIAKMRRPLTEREKRATKKIFSAPGGLETLVISLVNRLKEEGASGSEFVTQADITSIEYIDTFQWKITAHIHGNPPLGKEYVAEASHVISTVHSDQLRALLPPQLVDNYEKHMCVIESLDYAPIAEITVGYDHLPDVNAFAFGALVPSREHRDILGVLFPSSCFTERVPYADSRLFSIFVGGARHPDLLDLSDDALIEVAMGELTTMLRIPDEVQPALVHLSRHPKAIAQYTASTEKRLTAIKEIERAYPGLVLAGSIRDGIGLAQRITQGSEIGKQVALQHQQLERTASAITPSTK